MLPHRYPFLLVDRVLELEPHKRLRGIKNVTINEPFFQGHFPGMPVMPGVLQVEAMAQAGGILAARTSDYDPERQVMMFMAGRWWIRLAVRAATAVSVLLGM